MIASSHINFFNSYKGKATLATQLLLHFFIPPTNIFANAQYIGGSNARYCRVDASVGLTENDRACLQTCNVIDGVPEPQHAQWEAFCRTTATSNSWPRQCKEYYECVLNCDVSNRLISEATTGGNIGRQLLLLRQENLTGEDKCEMKKCESYCMFQTQKTCREESFRMDCEVFKERQFNPCDVKCNSALGGRRGRGSRVLGTFSGGGAHSLVLGMALATVLWAGGGWWR